MSAWLKEWCAAGMVFSVMVTSVTLISAASIELPRSLENESYQAKSKVTQTIAPKKKARQNASTRKIASKKATVSKNQPTSSYPMVDDKSPDTLSYGAQALQSLFVLSKAGSKLVKSGLKFVRKHPVKALTITLALQNKTSSFRMPSVTANTSTSITASTLTPYPTTKLTLIFPHFPTQETPAPTLYYSTQETTPFAPTLYYPTQETTPFAPTLFHPATPSMPASNLYYPTQETTPFLPASLSETNPVNSSNITALPTPSKAHETTATSSASDASSITLIPASKPSYGIIGGAVGGVVLGCCGIIAVVVGVMRGWCGMHKKFSSVQTLNPELGIAHPAPDDVTSSDYALIIVTQPKAPVKSECEDMPAATSRSQYDLFPQPSSNSGYVGLPTAAK